MIWNSQQSKNLIMLKLNFDSVHYDYYKHAKIF